MAVIKNAQDLRNLRESGRRLAAILRRVAKEVRPGISARELDALTEELIRSGGDTPAFLNYQPHGAARPYPATLNVSINDEVVHGIPNEKEKIIKEGDIVLLDSGLAHEGMYSDMAVTVPVGTVDPEGLRLIEVTRTALMAGVAACRPGNRVRDISEAVYRAVDGSGFSLVEELGGHGLGYKQHEDPFIPNVPMKGKSAMLKPGMVIAVEPNDDYTYKTVDGKRSAEFEHTILITDGDPEIITA